MRGLDAAAANNVADIHVARAMVGAGLDGLFALGLDRQRGKSLLADVDGDALENHYLRVITDEAVGRAYLKLPPPAPKPDLTAALTKQTADMRADQARMQALVEKLAAAMAPKIGPLFCEAAREYCAGIETTKGPEDTELEYLRHRTAVFIALCGDKPVTEYTKDDLQHIVNEVSRLPPNISKTESEYDIQNVLDYIAEAKKTGKAGIGESTLVNNYLGKVKTIMKARCESVNAPFVLANARIRIPKYVPPPKIKLLPDYAMLTKLFRAGAESGNFVSALLPFFGFLTGRRLGLLAFLRREDIWSYHDTWIAIPRPAIFENGEWRHAPFKTDESLTYFVLHNRFEKIGLIEFLKQNGEGYIFEELHAGGIKDPADTAQKRMGRLYDDAKIDRASVKTFHAMRDLRIDACRDLELAPRTIRVQVGHELQDIHDNYGSRGLRRSELRALVDAPLPDEIDWSLFEGLDFEALWQNRITRGRRPKRK